MNEQYITLVGKVYAPRYEEVYTPEVKSKLPIEASSEGRNLKNYTIYGNNNPNHVDENQSTLPVNIDTYGGNAVDWEFYGNNNPVIETESNTLPIDISSSGGNAIDYTIYGNDDVGENHWHQNAYSTTINDVSISADTSSLTISSNGSSATISATDNVWKNAIKTLIGNGEYTYQYAITGTHTNMAIGFYKSDNTSVFTTNQNTYSGTFTSDNAEYYNGFYLPKGWSGNITVTQMLVKGSTAPDHYIPYQKGVGENTEITGELPIDFRSNGDDLLGYKIYGTADGAGVQTENLMQVIATSKKQNGITFTVDGACRIIINGNATANASLYIDWVLDKASAVNDVEPSTTYTVSGGLNTTGVMFYWGTFNSDGTHTQSTVSTSATFTTDATAEKSRAFIYVTSGTVCDNLVCEPMLVKGSTPPETYIPYGHKLSLTLTSGTESKDTDIYIGDSKLGEAEYVDYGEQKIYKRILFMTHDDKHFITKDNKDFCLRRRGYSG